MAPPVNLYIVRSLLEHGAINIGVKESIWSISARRTLLIPPKITKYANFKRWAGQFITN